MLYNSMGILILEMILYIVVYIVVIPLVLYKSVSIFLEILKVKNKQNSKKIFACSIFVLIILSVLLSNNVSVVFNSTTTSINGKKDSDLQSRINQILDFKERKTEIIYAKTENINTFNETVRTRQQRSDGTYRYKERRYYYLNIRDGEYIIPLSSMADPIVIENLLYNKNYGEQVNYLNKIEVYKNTKFIKSINGIDIDSDYETRKKFSKEKEYKIEIKISEDGILQYETEGCTLEEYIHNNEDVTVGVYNELGDFVVIAGQLFGSKEEKLNKTFIEELNINKLAMHCYPDGIYYAYVCKGNLGNLEIISNAVKFRVEKRKAIDF